ncbi:hypothetical protein EV122DRAFT_285513 [Schizophyllum commune]
MSRPANPTRAAALTLVSNHHHVVGRPPSLPHPSRPRIYPPSYSIYATFALSAPPSPAASPRPREFSLGGDAGQQATKTTSHRVYLKNRKIIYTGLGSIQRHLTSNARPLAEGSPPPPTTSHALPRLIVTLPTSAVVPRACLAR